MKRARVRISGRVQGVCYRQSTVAMASGVGLCGWVRNLADGGVEALFEGEAALVEAAIRWCHAGPARARVDTVAVEWLDGPAECAGFVIRY